MSSSDTGCISPMRSGVDPAVGVRELEDAILRQDPGLDVQPVHGPHGARATCRCATHDVRRADQRARSHRSSSGREPSGHVHRPRRCRKDPPRASSSAPASPIASRAVSGWSISPGFRRRTRSPTRWRRSSASTPGMRPTTLTAVTAALAHWSPCAGACSTIASTSSNQSLRSTVAILGAAEHVRVLATSRRPLGVDGEYVRPVSPLAEDDAVRLFADRARPDSRGFGGVGRPRVRDLPETRRSAAGDRARGEPAPGDGRRRDRRPPRGSAHVPRPGPQVVRLDSERSATWCTGATTY